MGAGAAIEGRAPIRGSRPNILLGGDLVRLAALILVLSGFATAAEEADLRAALDAHRWFDLRDAMCSRKVPPLYRFFVAVAFNDERGAEKELSTVARSGASREQLADMHHALYRLYYRNGHYRKAALEERQTWALAPDFVPSAAAKADAEVVERLPDLEVASRRPATTTFTHWPGSAKVIAPLTINEQAAQFAIDTDASISVTTEAEAKRLGMKMTVGQALFDGISGERSTNGRYAVADRLRIGNTEIRNVAFLVLPDDLEVLADVPLGQRGGIGLPVLLALQTIRWNGNRELSVGFPPGRADLRTANLSFEELDPLTTVEVEGRRLAVDLDTGCEISDMWPLFVKELPELLHDSRKEVTTLAGATGATALDAAVMPELRLKVAGFPIVLRDVPALFRTTIPASNWHYGQLCMDVSTQATEFTLDFRALRIQLK
ncbi:MAG: retropepsin-like aspartic protease [Bryobacteraceae bacterium]|jgi:hypothetical protein